MANEDYDQGEDWSCGPGEGVDVHDIMSGMTLGQMARETDQEPWQLAGWLGWGHAEEEEPLTQAEAELIWNAWGMD